ncbi:MAG TPA: exosortase/archaeosortase family protein [Planctomycetaceae bacterium]|nr:exosortase/archaeosortase family protein [Planctomycetaceae bacterium]
MPSKTDLSPNRKSAPPSDLSNDRSAAVKQTQAADSSLPRLFVVIAMLAGIIWVYWRDLLVIQRTWESDPQYSHGYLVPLIAGFLLWTRRESFTPKEWSASWPGIALLATGLGAKIYASYYFIEGLNHLSLIIVLAGGVVCLWGTAGLKWAWPGVLFLVFMLPLPYRVDVAMQGPLRSVGTLCSTFFLQTLGFPAFREGYVISIGEQSVGVAEACSGIRMLMVFFALSSAVALVIDESWKVRLGLIVSAVPIAMIANVLRITATAAMYYFFSDSEVFGMPGTEFAGKFFHDWAGWFMIPIALFLLWFELWLLDHLVIKVQDRPMVMGINSKSHTSERTPPSPQRSASHS